MKKSCRKTVEETVEVKEECTPENDECVCPPKSDSETSLEDLILQASEVEVTLIIDDDENE